MPDNKDINNLLDARADLSSAVEAVETRMHLLAGKWLLVVSGR